MTAQAAIAGAAETAYARRGEGGETLPLLVEAGRLALEDAGLRPRDVDGLAVASFSLAPDRAVDVAWRMGLTLRWLSDEQTGGASALNMLQHASRAVGAGDADVVLLLAGDSFADFAPVSERLNSVTRDHLAPIPHGGPNALFALLTRRQMAAHGLTREHYGRVVAALHRAAGRTLSLDEYLAAPMVSDPLTRFDCVPIAAGAGAIVVSRRGDVVVRALETSVNVDQQEGDGLVTGLSSLATRLWERGGVTPAGVDVACVYDDYPAMILAQLADLGFGDPVSLVEQIEAGRLRVNTSGGQLVNGQAGVAGGMHGLVEAVRRLRGDARTAVVTGYGMIVYRHGAISNAAVLARRE